MSGRNLQEESKLMVKVTLIYKKEIVDRINIFLEEDDGPGFFGPRVYSQEPIMDEEKIQEMEEIREEPEEEREGPFNLFGWFRG